MAWKTVVHKTETVRTHNTASDRNCLLEGACLLTILGQSGTLCYFRFVSAV